MSDEAKDAIDSSVPPAGEICREIVVDECAILDRQIELKPG